MDERPNVIFIMCDQMRGDALGADGNPHVQTPNLDYLASRGTRFRHAYSAVPSCLPARAILWTGQNQWHAGILGMGWGQGAIPDDYPHTLAGGLSAAGYRTHMVGKGHFTPQRAMMGFQSIELDESARTLANGFADEYRQWFAGNAPSGTTPDDHGVDWNSWHARPWHLAEHLHPTAWTMARSLEFLRTRDRHQPYFLNISFARPHSPYVPPQPFWDLYADAELPPPHIGDWASMHDQPRDAMDPNAWRGNVGRDRTLRARRGYYGEISFIDCQIGRLLAFMSRFCGNDLARTWFVFTSDHGDMQGDHHLWRKTHAYEGSARIPMLVVPPLRGNGPAVRPVATEVTELRDIMPTVLDIAGVATPPTVDGTSLLPVMHADGAPWRTHIHGEHCKCYSGEQEMQFVSDGRRKFIWLPRINREQFFDLEQDPRECHDLVADPGRQDEVAPWRARLVEELAARNCGWVQNGALCCPRGEALVSPWKEKRRTAPQA